MKIAAQRPHMCFIKSFNTRDKEVSRKREMFAQRDVSQRKAHKVKETCYVRNAADPALDCYCSELHKYIYKEKRKDKRKALH